MVACTRKGKPMRMCYFAATLILLATACTSPAEDGFTADAPSGEGETDLVKRTGPSMMACPRPTTASC